MPIAAIIILVLVLAGIPTIVTGKKKKLMAHMHMIIPNILPIYLYIKP